MSWFDIKLDEYTSVERVLLLEIKKNNKYQKRLDKKYRKKKYTSLKYKKLKKELVRNNVYMQSTLDKLKFVRLQKEEGV